MPEPKRSASEIALIIIAITSSLTLIIYLIFDWFPNLFRVS